MAAPRSFVSRRIMAFAAPVIGIALAALILWPLLDRKLSPVTSGVMIGAAGAICLLGIALGIWNVRRSEARRKAKEQIWLKHWLDKALSSITPVSARAGKVLRGPTPTRRPRRRSSRAIPTDGSDPRSFRCSTSRSGRSAPRPRPRDGCRSR